MKYTVPETVYMACQQQQQQTSDIIECAKYWEDYYYTVRGDDAGEAGFGYPGGRNNNYTPCQGVTTGALNMEGGPLLTVPTRLGVVSKPLSGPKTVTKAVPTKLTAPTTSSHGQMAINLLHTGHMEAAAAIQVPLVKTLVLMKVPGLTPMATDQLAKTLVLHPRGRVMHPFRWKS